jgi:hypothetical protein
VYVDVDNILKVILVSILIFLKYWCVYWCRQHTKNNLSFKLLMFKFVHHENLYELKNPDFNEMG